MFTPIVDQFHPFRDTCNVYILCSGREAVLVDFGSGDVLDHLAEIGVEPVTDVLITHHHRDQGQGLLRAVQAGIRIWVPHTEQDLFHSVDAHGQPLRVTPEYLQKIASDAEAIDRLHPEIMPEAPDLGAEGFLARISPHQVAASAGETIPFEVEIRNPFPHPEEATIQVVVPQGWSPEPMEQTLQIAGVHQLSFQVTPPLNLTIRRARVAVDLAIAGQRFGQQAEALITILP